MNSSDQNTMHDDRFATDLEAADAASAPARAADSLVVHGMLSMIAPDEPARLEARIERAIAAVHAESAHLSPIARIGHSARGNGLAQAGAASWHHAWRRRIALAGGGIGIAAVLGFAVLFTPSGQSQSGSQAYAALDSIRAATARTDDRTFRVRLEHVEPRGPMAARGALRDGTRQQRDGTREPRDGAREPRDGAREPRDGARERVREGELVLGSGGRYTLTWNSPASDRIPGRGGPIVSGFSGDEYWVVLPDGTVRTSANPAEIRLPPLIGTEPSRPGDDEDVEHLTLDSMLARLERGYDITFADRAPAAAEGGAPLVEVTATRRAGAGRRDRDRSMTPPFPGAGRGRPGGPGGPRGERNGPGGDRPGPGGDRPGPGGDRPGPDTVQVLADASTFDVERLEARWTTGPARTLVIERVSEPGNPVTRPAEWFTPAAHARSR
jgi:hypothetical protein